jgi:exocyst complex component 6
MTITTPEDYDEVLSATWFVDERSPEEITYVARPDLAAMGFVQSLTRPRFPTVLPFSKMYPLCCVDIRSFAKQFLAFTEDNFDHPNIVDETLRKVCQPSPNLT